MKKRVSLLRWTSKGNDAEQKIMVYIEIICARNGSRSIGYQYIIVNKDLVL